MKQILQLLFALSIYVATTSSINQTETVSPILPPDSLPFDVTVEEAGFNLPNGIHSGAVAVHNDEWLFLCGRTNGLHGFEFGPTNFPPQKQNTVAYVVDVKNQLVYSRSLDSANSGLTSHQVDLLSVTSPQYSQTGKTLYICGGYGVDSATGLFSTKDTLTAINVPGFIKWVKGSKKQTAAGNIRQTSHPLLRVTGGFMQSIDNHLFTLLIFGQNFTGFYNPGSNGEYTQQVRCFQIVDNGDDLYVQARESEHPNPEYRRRDLNVVPILHDNQQAFVALSGVFTIPGGVWTVPVTIQTDGSTYMPDPNKNSTFKQGMNNYTSALAPLYSGHKNEMFMIIFGGLSFEFFQNGVLQQDEEIPFINQITTVKIDKDNKFSQHLIAHEYPIIASTGTNPGNQLLFGAGAWFLPSRNVELYSNGVIQFDKIREPTLIGYIVGGIMSTLPNTNTKADSAASPYIFKVMLYPK